MWEIILASGTCVCIFAGTALAKGGYQTIQSECPQLLRQPGLRASWPSGRSSPLSGPLAPVAQWSLYCLIIKDVVFVVVCFDCWGFFIYLLNKTYLISSRGFCFIINILIVSKRF